VVRDIITPRLRLRLMPAEFLEACLDNDIATAEARIELTLSPEWLQEKHLMTLRLKECHADPAYRPWSVRAMGLASSGRMIGHIGFHSPPDPEYLRRFVPDGIEVGYTVFAAYRRQGFAQEALGGLLSWATARSALRHVVASIAPTNVASTALAQKLGFVKVGEHQDEVDGLEYVYVLAGEALRQVLAAFSP
jgi:ribosomal-protein-alanine N-acetyltransferase